ncbi:hypothetical protein CR513_56251, partial [Mucuna pruriens]
MLSNCSTLEDSTMDLRRMFSRDVLGSIIRRLSRDEVVSAKIDSISAKPDQIRPGFTAQQPKLVQSNKEQPKDAIHELQLNCHVTSREACSASYARECRLGTKKPKVTRGDRLDYQRTLVDLILNVLASEGGPSPSTMVIVVEDGVTESRPC